ncbi:hypothetical protein ACAD32_00735 [Clavibacter nebraskensis]
MLVARTPDDTSGPREVIRHVDSARRARRPGRAARGTAVTVHVRLAAAVATLVDRMDDDTSEAWDSLTGLQVLLVRIIAGGDHVDRASLAMVARTARAATIPSLQSLIRKGMVAEVEDGGGTRLVLAEVGRAMLDDVDRARAAWLRRAAEEAEPPVREADLARAASLLEHVGAGPAEGATAAS